MLLGRFGIIRTGASSCISCFNKGRSCRLDPRFHFKAVRCVYQKSNDTASKFKLEWNSRQTWVKVPKDRTCRSLCPVPPSEMTRYWQQLADSVEHWYQSRPVSWQPLQYKEPDLSAARPFPESWIMSPSAVVGLQCYHTCCILLTLSNRHWGVSSEYELARLRHLDEKTVASHIVQVIGLSMSNETVANGYFMACHLLHRYAYTIRHPAEQRGSLCFLERVEKDVGWRTSCMMRHLEDQWGELSGLD